jgi:hypothetical protein
MIDEQPRWGTGALLVGLAVSHINHMNVDGLQPNKAAHVVYNF